MNEVNEIVGVVKEILQQVNSQPEIYTELAKVIKGMYDALVAQGFSEDQAMALISKQSGNLISK
ncbi:hypothetical protein D3C81_768310 [compost metagenome]